jgi:N-methylhydantoinase B
MFPPDVFDVREKKTILPLDEKIYASSTPVAGLLDPKTKVQSSDGEFFYFASRPSWSTDRFAIFRYQTSSGGGWGRPVDRDPERVLRDVRDEYISAAAARRDYGVVVLGDPVRDPEGLKIDWEATNALRSQMS